MANVHAGYRGILSGIGGGYLRFTDCSISPKQAVEIPDMVMGDWNHDAYAYGKIEVNGSLAGLVDEDFANTIWAWGFCRDACGLLTPMSPHLYYYCDSTGKDISFTDLYANSMSMSVAAGDIANWSVDVIGKTSSPYGTASAPAYNDTKKLVTWDKVSIGISGGDMGVPTTVAFQNFELSVANNCESVYAISSASNLFPYEVIPGIRTITGSITVFDVDDTFKGFDAWDDYTTTGQSTLSITIGGFSTSLNVRFHRLEPSMGTGPITSTVAFSGVGAQTECP